MGFAPDRRRAPIRGRSTHPTISTRYDSKLGNDELAGRGARTVALRPGCLRAATGLRFLPVALQIDISIMNRNYLAYSIGLLFACAIGTTAAQTVGPTADYKIQPENTSTSPDGTTTIEQYARIDADGNYT